MVSHFNYQAPIYNLIDVKKSLRKIPVFTISLIITVVTKRKLGPERMFVTIIKNTGCITNVFQI